MPWKKQEPVDQRLLFIAAVEQEPDEPFSALCARFEISRKTGYKWVERYNSGGPTQLHDRASAPRVLPHATSTELIARILDARRAHPRWGPKKLRALLLERDPAIVWPAASTFGDLLKRHGMIIPRCRRVRWIAPRADRPAPAAPNDTWCVDFKGDFALGNGSRCYPLTVTDLYARYVLGIDADRRIDTVAVRAHFERLFSLFGVPARMRSDNGVPFATTAPGGLSPLAIWWIKLGIVLERITPGHPEQNGAHERMHRTLKDETTKPPERDLASQQVRFDRFRREFNEVRPHEALDQRTPASQYTPSLRALPAIVGDPTYTPGWRKLRVCGSGNIEMRGHRVQIHKMLVGELVGLEPVDDDRWAVFFGAQRLGEIDVSAPSG